MKKVILYLKVARAQTLLMTVFLIICAFLYSRYNYKIDLNLCFVFVSLSIIFFHLATNTLSEYRDCVKGVDDVHSPGTKYRLITGVVPSKHIYYFGIVAFSLASLSGIIALCLGTKLLLIPGILGAAIVFFYSENPIGLKYKAFGEICVFLGYGPLFFSACILALHQSVSWKDLQFSVPFGLMTTCVLLANNIRDYSFEKGKTTTMTVKYGLRFSYFLLFLMVHLSFLMIPFLVYQNILVPYAFYVFFIYPLIFLSLNKIGKPEFVNIFGVMQVLFTIINCLSFVAQILLQS